MSFSGKLQPEVQLVGWIGHSSQSRATSSPLFDSLLNMTIDRDWDKDALCAEVGDEIFYPERGSSPKEAKSVCASCSVRPECLEYSLRFPYQEDHGVWGGTTEGDRRILRAARRFGIEFDYDNPDISEVERLVEIRKAQESRQLSGVS
jgi:WhiB family redox-sensing transcriptional regulator